MPNPQVHSRNPKANDGVKPHPFLGCSFKELQLFCTNCFNYDLMRLWTGWMAKREKAWNCFEFWMEWCYQNMQCKSYETKKRASDSWMNPFILFYACFHNQWTLPYVESILVKKKCGFYTRERKKMHFCWLLAFKMIRVRIFDPRLFNFFHNKPKILLNQHMLKVSTWKVIKSLKKFAHLQKNGKGFS